MIEPDWNLIRAFEATARAGSLSAAARTLGLTQPTLSRQIAALEAALGVTLFDRVGKRLVLTEAAGGLLAHARGMSEAAGALSLAAAGQAHEVAGTVTVSASDGVAAYLLPGILGGIGRAWPQIAVHVVVSNGLSDLRRREADIAIRHVRPEQPELIGRLAQECPVHFYASQAWVSARGGTPLLSQLGAQDILAFAPVERFVEQLRGCGIEAPSGGFRFASENSVTLWEMARRGLGVCAMLREIGARTPDMIPMAPERPLFHAPIWIVSHRELRTSRRCRIIFDALAEAFAAPAR
jgi:DNA-binding transcriptional LysR family regulator